MQFSSSYLRLENLEHGVKKIIFTRPKVKNAFNAQMISDLHSVFSQLSENTDHENFRLLILTSEEDTFCAGADLNYMQSQSEKTYEDNLLDANKLGDMFYKLAKIPCPVISAVKGAAIGGGFGLCACSDYVLAEENSVFATSEVRIGLIPAVISPYIVRKLGIAQSSFLMLSGDKIKADQALRINFVNKICASDEFEEVLKNIVDSFLMAEPRAARATKGLIQKSSLLPDQMLFEYTTEQIARIRSSKEGKAGLNYFLNKKRPHWCP